MQDGVTRITSIRTAQPFGVLYLNFNRKQRNKKIRQVWSPSFYFTPWKGAILPFKTMEVLNDGLQLNKNILLPFGFHHICYPVNGESLDCQEKQSQHHQ